MADHESGIISAEEMIKLNKVPKTTEADKKHSKKRAKKGGKKRGKNDSDDEVGDSSATDAPAKKKAKKTRPAGDKTKEVQNETNEARQRFIDNAPLNEHVQHGVYVVRGNAHNHKHELTGYLNQPKTGGLFVLVHGITALLRSHMDIARDNYGCDKPVTLKLGDIFFHLKSIKLSDIALPDTTEFDYSTVDLTDRNALSSEERQRLRGDDLTDLDTYSKAARGGNRRACLIWLRHCFRGIQAANAYAERNNMPKPFSGTRDEKYRRSTHDVVHEDISRWFAFVSMVKYDEGQFKNSAQGKAGTLDFIGSCAPQHRSSKHNDQLASFPLFKLADGPPPATATDKQIQSRVLERLKLQNKLKAHPDFSPNFSNKGRQEQSEEDIDKLTDALVNGLQVNRHKFKKGGKKSKKHRSELAAIETDFLKKAIAAMHQTLVVYYDRTPDDCKRDLEQQYEAAKLSPEEQRQGLAYAQALGDYQARDNETVSESRTVKPWIQDMQARAKSDSDYARMLLEHAGNLDELTADDYKNLQAEVRVHKAFRTFQSSINSLSAAPPDFDETIEKWKLETDGVDSHGIPRVKSGKTFLFPHQVQGVGWGAGMLTSKIKTGVLADETGLGKTITGYATADAVDGKITRDLEAHGFKITAGEESFSMKMLPASAAALDQASMPPPPKPDPDSESDSDSEPDDDAPKTPDQESRKKAHTDTPDDDDDAEEIPDDDIDTDNPYLIAEPEYTQADKAQWEKIVKRNEEIKQQCREKGIAYFQPTFVACPPAANSVHLTELSEQHPDRIIWAFMGVGTASTRSNAGKIFPGGVPALEKYVEGLDVTDPATAKVTIVTTYNTAEKRFLRQWWLKKENADDKEESRYPLQKLTLSECKKFGIDPLQMDLLMTTGKHGREAKEGHPGYDLRCKPNLFGTAIYDEMHKLTNPGTLIMKTLLKLKPSRVLMMTASPFMNRLRDFYTIIKVATSTADGLDTTPVADPDIKPDADAASDPELETSDAAGQQGGFVTDTRRENGLSVEDYMRAADRIEQAGNSWLNIEDTDMERLVAPVLDSDSFYSIMDRSDQNPIVARQVVPGPMKLLVLRRVGGQVIHLHDTAITVGEDIPAYHVTLVELRQTDQELALYRRAHEAKIGEADEFIAPNTTLKKYDLDKIDPKTAGQLDDYESETVGRQNIDKRRRLQSATANALMDQFYHYGINADAKQVVGWWENNGGESGPFYFIYSRTDEGWGPSYADRISQATYLSAVSAKSQYFLQWAHHVINELKTKAICYLDWPAHVFLYRTLADIIGWKVERISAGQTPRERADILRRFNDPEDKSIELLICSSRSAAESINLQKGGHHILIVDIVSFPTILQIIGRCYRLGQNHPQYIKILMTDGTYDQRILAMYSTSFIAQLSATTRDYVATDEDVARYLADPDHLAEMKYRVETNGTDMNYEAAQALLDNHIEMKLGALFGIRTPRNNDYWANEKNPNAKWLIDYEADFYVSKCGGEVAKEVIAFREAQKVGEQAEKDGKDAVETIRAHKAQNRTVSTPRNKGISDSLLQQNRTAERERKKATYEAEASEREAKRAAKREKKEKKERAELLKGVENMLGQNGKTLADVDVDVDTMGQMFGWNDGQRFVIRQAQKRKRGEDDSDTDMPPPPKKSQIDGLLTSPGPEASPSPSEVNDHPDTEAQEALLKANPDELDSIQLMDRIFAGLIKSFLTPKFTKDILAAACKATGLTKEAALNKATMANALFSHYRDDIIATMKTDEDAWEEDGIEMDDAFLKVLGDHPEKVVLPEPLEDAKQATKGKGKRRKN